MDDDSNKGTLIQAKLGTKQRIAQAKLRAAERRALEIAARHAEGATTPSPSPLPASPFIRTSTPSSSNYVPGSNALLWSSTTGVEHLAPTISVKELSKKIVTAGNSELQELITKMILWCPGAKEIAGSFFVSNEVQSNDEEVVNRGGNDAASQENGDEHDANHVTPTIEGAVDTESNEGRMRADTLGGQPNPNAQTHVTDQPTDSLNMRQDDNPSALYLASHPKHNSMFRSSDAHTQLDLEQQEDQSEAMQIEEVVGNLAPTNIDENSQKFNTATAQGESETALASKTAEKTSRNPMNDALLGNLSDTEITIALDALPSNTTKSPETSAFHNPSRGTPQIPFPEVSENLMDTGPSEVPTTDITQLVNDISARYMNLARHFGPGNFPFDKLASIAAETLRNASAREFSFESLVNIIDSVRKNIQTMQRAIANNLALESMTQSVLEISTDLGSPIPMDANGQELERSPVFKDGINPVIQEAVVSAESADSEEDEYVDTANIISGHYNCDSCRKPIVLPEVFIVSPENPAPTTCLHCKTRKASGITRRKLGSRVRSNISTEVSTIETDNQSPDKLSNRISQNSETANQIPRIVPVNLGSLPESFSEPLPDQSPEPLPEPLSECAPEVPEGSLVSVEAEEKDTGGKAMDRRLGEKDYIKHEDRGDTIIVEIPAWHGPKCSQVPTSQTPANDQIAVASLGKRRVRSIEGEAVYSSPIGPKRRRGRPWKSSQATMSKSSPSSSSTNLIPALNQSTQANSTPKKKGRPFATKSGVKLEKWEPNKLMEETWEPKKPMEYTSAIRPISQRMSARKSREITQDLLSERQDFVEDLVQDRTQDVTRDINHHPRPIKETPAITYSDDGSIPQSRGARRRRSKILKWERKLMALQRDSGSGHSQTQGSEFRTRSTLMTGAMPDNDMTSTSFSDTFSAEMDVQGPASQIPVGRGEQSERTGDLSFNGDREMPQSIVEQGSLMTNGDTTSTTVLSEHGNVDGGVTGSLEGNKSGVEKVVGSIIPSINDKMGETSEERSNITRNSTKLGDGSRISKEVQDKVGDSSSEEPIPAHTETRLPMYPSSFPNIENQQPSSIAEPEPNHTTTKPLIPNRSQSHTPLFDPATFFTRSFGPHAIQPQPSPSPVRRRPSPRIYNPRTLLPRPLMADIWVSNYSPFHQRPSQELGMPAYHTSPLVPNTTASHTFPPASHHPPSPALPLDFLSVPNSGFENQNDNSITSSSNFRPGRTLDRDEQYFWLI